MSDPFEGWSRALLIRALGNADDAAFRSATTVLKLDDLVTRLAAALAEASKRLPTDAATEARRIRTDALAARAKAMAAQGKSKAYIGRELGKSTKQVGRYLERP